MIGSATDWSGAKKFWWPYRKGRPLHRHISKIKDIVRTQPVRVPFCHAREPVDEGADLGASETRRAEKDAGVRFLPLNGVSGQRQEVTGITRYKAAALLSRISKLFGVGELKVPHFVGAEGVHSVLSQGLRNLRRKVLI